VYVVTHAAVLSLMGHLAATDTMLTIQYNNGVICQERTDPLNYDTPEAGAKVQRW